MVGICKIKLVGLVLCLFVVGSIRSEPWYKYLHNKFLALTAPTPTCGYETCNLGKKGMLNIHLIPHTHDDMGWLKTVDQYYYGADRNIHWGAVQYVLDTVMEELFRDPDRRFIYVEIGFFYRWWNQQNDIMRHRVKRIVNEGRLEFILGGWTQNDEACTHYNAIIDQHTLGFKFLKDNFGDCARPRVAWQIDPFGHSREQASLFAQMGFDGVFFARDDYREKEYQRKNKSLEVLWSGSDILGAKSDLFTGAFYGHYGAPPGFCFDAYCNDDPIMDDDRLQGYNVNQKVEDFIQKMTRVATGFKTNHVQQTMGDDFAYTNARMWFKNMDKLIKYVNARQSNGSKINVLYSTPSCYLYAVNKAKVALRRKFDDFFPYASGAHSFWTGYFTSRPALKGYVRKTNNFLQVCKQLDVLAQLGQEHSSTLKVDTLRRAMATLQHHDAITGTAKQNVTYDYAQRLANGVTQCEYVVNHATRKLLSKTADKAPEQFFCNLMNISMCNVTENLKAFTMTVYNPIARPLNSWVRIPVAGSAYKVTSPDGRILPIQLVPVTTRTATIPERTSKKAKYELVLNVSLPALGYSTYFFRASSNATLSRLQRSELKNMTNDLIIKNQHVSLTFDGALHILTSMTNLGKRRTLEVSQGLLYYLAYQGNNTKEQWRSSGAYIFRPTTTRPISLTDVPAIKFLKGPHVQEIHQKFSVWATQVLRLYNDAKHIEIEWTVGPIPIDDKRGKEVISQFITKLPNNGKFYTDANGRQILKRARNHRETYPFNQTEAVAGNYYPVNSRIFIRDESQSTVQLSVLTDRSQGGASIVDGAVELMVHRRLLNDDLFGVDEALNERGSDGKGMVVRGSHYVIFDDVLSSGQLHRDLGERLFMKPSVSFSASNETYAQWSKKYHTLWSSIKRALPNNVHLLTMEQWKGRNFLLRLEHFYEQNEDPVGSKPVSVSLQNLFVPFSIQSVEELTLGGNQKLSESDRLQWTTIIHEPRLKSHNFTDDPIINRIGDPLDILLKPMEIRTFDVTVN